MVWMTLLGDAWLAVKKGLVRCTFILNRFCWRSYLPGAAGLIDKGYGEPFRTDVAPS